MLPLLTAAAFLVGSLHAYRATPLSQWGEAYSHVPMHLVAAAAALLVGLAVLSVARRGRTPRARRTGRRCAAGWALVGGAFLLEAYGATIGNGYGESSVHSAAVLVLLPCALVLLVTTLHLLVARDGALPWPLRPVLLVSIPAVPALSEAQDTVALALGLASAAGWTAVAVHALRPVRSAAPAALLVPGATS